jgi:hypothetical protein
MRPVLWQPPVALSKEERSIVGRIRRAKLFVFLRERRHDLFSEAFQGELATLYADSPLGQPPIAPAQLALALILQASTGVSDDEVIEATTMDRRWIGAGSLPSIAWTATNRPLARGLWWACVRA